jgi:hypothetical protein
VFKQASERVLTRAKLYGVIDAATRVSVTRQAAGSMLDLGAAIATVLAGTPARVERRSLGCLGQRLRKGVDLG